jgi:hypothetical protein
VRLESADKKWTLLTLAQQEEMPDVVKHQGPTSAALSTAWSLGFELDNLVPGHPMLGEVPVRKHLGLNNEQQRELQEVTARSAARREKLQLDLRSGKPEASRDILDAEAKEMEEVEAALTPRQLTMLQELELRGRVALALEYPEKREAVGFSADQTTRLALMGQEDHERTYRIDREMLAQAIAILTPQQQDRAKDAILRRIYGKQAIVD